MKNLLLTLSILCSAALAQQKFSKVTIDVPTALEYTQLVKLGLPVDHFTGKIGKGISVYFNEREVQILRNNGIHFSVEIDDWQKFYTERQKQDRLRFQKVNSDVPKNFHYGSMGGFLINDEVLQQLDSMHLLFPNIISQKDSIGVTNEGRKIYAVKISDNVAQNENTEPEVLYTALHHAREPEGMMTVIYYMWWLLENYGKDPEATYLVNNRQMYFIPVVNVDGYEYNRSIKPNGGGMWRKNRRNNGDSTFGVDLNRNYGPEYMWNAPNNGSGLTTDDETYRGIAPFSEPETQAIRNFVFAHNFKTCFNYHTYSDLLIYPWGYASKESPDYKIFRDWTYALTTQNRYATGTDLQTVQYSTRGNSDDFMYGDTTNGRSKTFTMTPEVGSTGFWPTVAEIIPLAQENLNMNKLLAHFAGSYIKVRASSPVSIVLPNKSTDVSFTFFNEGLAASTALPIYFSSQSGMNRSSEMLPAINAQEAVSKDFPISISSESTNNEILQYTIGAFDSTINSMSDSVKIFFGTPDTLLFDDASNGTSQWNIGSGWGTVDSSVRKPHSKPFSFTDSPLGTYKANTENSLTLKNQITLSGYQSAELRFYTYWEIESTWDFAVIEVSTNNGVSWTNCQTKLSRKASAIDGSKQPINTFGYDAYTPSGDWIEQSVDLTPFLGKNILIRFRMSSDVAENRDGWYVDDIKILAYPTMPLLAQKEIIPFTYELSQNFPNPFNPVTTVFFQIPTRDFVTIKLYDILGREISTLANEMMEAGRYSLQIHAEKLSSGIYFYKMTSGNYSSLKKMVVLK